MRLRTLPHLASAVSGLATATLGLLIAAQPSHAADHVDLPREASTGMTIDRPDAAVTDFWTFVNDDKLVMILGINPFLPKDVMHYRFPTDVRYRFNIDNHSGATIGDDVISREFGGIIAYPMGISEDIVFEVTFDGSAAPILSVTGADAKHVRVFAGLRAEAFIFAPFVRNNIAGIVVEVPLAKVLVDKQQLLIWGTTSVTTPDGTFTELGGRALRSQFGPFVDLNALHPRDHVLNGFITPDVVILDTASASAFPNGRTLADDVVDIAVDFESLDTDPAAAGLEDQFCAPGGDFAPCPVPSSATPDDIRFKSSFPYLGAPFGKGVQP